MLKKQSKPELLSPVFDFVSLRAAIDAGADAVYFGVKELNMRATAKNFELGQLKNAVEICHKGKIKAYLALNTIVYDTELHLLEKIIGAAKKAKVDSIICWDPSVISAAKKAKIPIHISTQASVSNTDSARFYKKLGAERIVLARELSLKQISEIRKKADVWVECFIHGAMCVSVSGSCFMSQFVFGRSANRGDCLQPCRRKYFVKSLNNGGSTDFSLRSKSYSPPRRGQRKICDFPSCARFARQQPPARRPPRNGCFEGSNKTCLIKDVEEGYELELGQDYVMSPKDLCTLPFIEKLIEAGIDSFKIEGRARSPEYVKVVTECYREALDAYFDKKLTQQLKTRLMKRLGTVYNRGFSPGFYLGKPIDRWTTPDTKATEKKIFVGVVGNYYPEPGVAEIILQSGGIKLGDKIMFQGPTTGVFEQKAESMQISHKHVKEALKGKSVGIKVLKNVRKNDKVFIVKER